MNRDGHKDAVYFIGPEVEQTPAFSKRTLFVVGKQPAEQIEEMARANRTTHIFMGANHSFSVDPTDTTFYWDNTITALLDKGFWVTLDYQAHNHEQVLMMLNKGIWQSRLFVPLLSVRIPKVQTSSNNLTVKIDDIDFNATNPGVWCIHHHELTDSNRFTSWQEYGTDELLELPTAAVSVKPVAAKVTTVADNTKSLVAATDTTSEDDIPVKNDEMLGLDVKPTTALKPEEGIQDEKLPVTATPEDAAAAYAAGAKADPLGKEGAAKPTKKGAKV